MRIGDVTWLAINAHIPYGEPPQALLPDLKEALQTKVAELQSYTAKSLPETKQTALNYPMPYKTWESHINDATQAA